MITTNTYRKSPVIVSDTLRCLCINADPIIIITYGCSMAAATQLSPYLASKKVYFLVGAWWTYLDESFLRTTFEAYVAMKNVFPEHQYIFLTNDIKENHLLEQLNIPNFFCHHNAFIDESVFRPLMGSTKELDAIYTARLTKIKRHELARKINSWGLIYGYDISDYNKQITYLRRLRQKMPGMTLVNGDVEIGKYAHLTPRQVCEAYNSAHVGLCLSRMEGGNYSTTEYLLCGLPVVSTNNVGGRNFFLDPEISRTVPPDHEAILQAVEELIKQRLSPHFIRLQTLKKIQRVRGNFIELVNFILQEEGKAPCFADHFKTIFTNKMFIYPKSPEHFVHENGLA